MKIFPVLFAFVALCASGLGFDRQNETPAIFQQGERILFQGDSITDGNRGRTADPNHILGHGYVFLIAAKYRSTFPERQLTFINRGNSGDTVEALWNRWPADTLANKPDVLSVLIGINDVFFAMREHKPVDLGAYEKRYDQILADARRSNPALKLILCEPFLLPGSNTSDQFATWKKAVSDLGIVVERLGQKYHAPVVNFQKVFDEACQRAPVEHWIWDGIHPTYSGHQLMADEWVRAYNEFYVSPLMDPMRNSAIHPEVNFERDSYDWLHRHADELDAQRAGNPDVVMIGDSITHFWAGEPKSNHVNGPRSWDDTFRGVKVLNMGLGWDRTQNVLWRLQHGEFVGLAPKSIVLNIGTNNLVGDGTARENTPEETAVGIEQLVALLHERSPSSRIYVMGVFPRGFEKGNSLDRRITHLNAIVRTDLEQTAYVKLLDIGSQLREPDGSVSKDVLFDGTHPTDRGYAVWGNALKAAGAIPVPSGR